VYRRDKLVATVVSPALGQQLAEAKSDAHKPTLAAALSELRRLCMEEDYELVPPGRIDRPRSSRPRRR